MPRPQANARYSSPFSLESVKQARYQLVHIQIPINENVLVNENQQLSFIVVFWNIFSNTRFIIAFFFGLFCLLTLSAISRCVLANSKLHKIVHSDNGYLDILKHRIQQRTKLIFQAHSCLMTNLDTAFQNTFSLIHQQSSKNIPPSQNTTYSLFYTHTLSSYCFIHNMWQQ